MFKKLLLIFAITGLTAGFIATTFELDEGKITKISLDGNKLKMSFKYKLKNCKGNDNV